MSSIPLWLIQIVLGLVSNIGIPMLEKVLPMFPQAVWDAIQAIIAHVEAAPSAEEAKQRAEALHNAIKTIAVAPTTKGLGE